MECIRYSQDNFIPIVTTFNYWHLLMQCFRCSDGVGDEAMWCVEGGGHARRAREYPLVYLQFLKYNVIGKETKCFIKLIKWIWSTVKTN